MAFARWFAARERLPKTVTSSKRMEVSLPRWLASRDTLPTRRCETPTGNRIPAWLAAPDHLTDLPPRGTARVGFLSWLMTRENLPEAPNEPFPALPSFLRWLLTAGSATGPGVAKRSKEVPPHEP
jgi:hypothetical protein